MRVTLYRVLQTPNACFPGLSHTSSRVFPGFKLQQQSEGNHQQEPAQCCRHTVLFLVQQCTIFNNWHPTYLFRKTLMLQIVSHKQWPKRFSSQFLRCNAQQWKNVTSKFKDCRGCVTTLFIQCARSIASIHTHAHNIKCKHGHCGHIQQSTNVVHSPLDTWYSQRRNTISQHFIKTHQ